MEGNNGTSDIHPDLLTMEQIDSIQAEIAATQPLIGKEVGVDSLLEHYKDAHLPAFRSGIQNLAVQYRYMRKVRGDGNCFYRALWFGYLEILLKSHHNAQNATEKAIAEVELQRLISKVKGSLQELVALGYSEFAIECFYEELLEILETLVSNTIDSLEEMFQEGGKAEYLNWYMRLLTAGHLRRHADRFLPFVEGCFVDMDAFCKSEVEPMNKECEQLHILALAEYLELQVEIAYLDGKSEEVPKVLIPDTPQTCPYQVSLLYRPGHYDVLYK